MNPIDNNKVDDNSSIRYARGEVSQPDPSHIEKLRKIISSWSSAFSSRFIPDDHASKTKFYMQDTVNCKDVIDNLRFVKKDTTPEDIDQFCAKQGLKNWNFNWGILSTDTVLGEAITLRNEILLNHIIKNHPYLINVGRFSSLFYGINRFNRGLPNAEIEMIYRFIKILIELGADINRGCQGKTPLQLAVQENVEPLIDLFVFCGGGFYETNDLEELEGNSNALRASVSRLYERVRPLCLGLYEPESIWSKVPKEICYRLMMDKLGFEIFADSEKASKV